MSQRVPSSGSTSYWRLSIFSFLLLGILDMSDRADCSGDPQKDSTFDSLPCKPLKVQKMSLSQTCVAVIGKLASNLKSL